MSWAGIILRVDLTEEKIEKQPTGVYTHDYIGGGAIGAKIIYDEVPPEVSALDPKNILSFNAGHLTGTLLGNKCEVMFKSPQYTRNLMATTGMGGQWPSELKFAGYDHLVVKGKADAPVYLFINNDDVEVRDAKHLWGLDVYETQAKIKEELSDPEVQIVCIGPAGENMIAYSMIVHDIQNTASRGGAGGVMGSKNLKAIAVRGTKGLKIGDLEGFIDCWEEYFRQYVYGESSLMTLGLHRYGYSRDVGDFYWRKGYEAAPYGYYDTYETPILRKEHKMGTFLGKYRVGAIGCAFCPVQCAQNYDVPGMESGGAMCMCYGGFRFMVKSVNPKLWWRAQALCNRYGIDVITMSNITGWLMLLFEKGIITAADTDGMPMEWGSENAVVTVIEKVSRKEGFGKLIADGIVPAAERIGKDSIKLTMQTKNYDAWTTIWQPWTAHSIGSAIKLSEEQMSQPCEVDVLPAIAATSEEYGMSIEEARAYVMRLAEAEAEKQTGDKDAWRPGRYEGKGLFLKANEDIVQACNISSHCDFLSDRLAFSGSWGSVADVARWISGATGREITTERLLETIQRMRLLQRSYDVLCGTTAEEEIFQDWFYEPVPDGMWKGTKMDRDKWLKARGDYYAARGWDRETGIPTREALEKAGLKDVADRLEKAGKIPKT